MSKLNGAIVMLLGQPMDLSQTSACPGHQLRICQQGESFMFAEHTTTSPAAEGPTSEPQPDLHGHLEKHGYLDRCSSLAPLPPTLPQVSARLASIFGRDVVNFTCSAADADLELICEDTGRVLGRWTMGTLLKQTGSKRGASWWRNVSCRDYFLSNSMEWSPDASHLLVRCPKFLLVLAFDTHLHFSS